MCAILACSLAKLVGLHLPTARLVSMDTSSSRLTVAWLTVQLLITRSIKHVLLVLPNAQLASPLLSTASPAQMDISFTQQTAHASLVVPLPLTFQALPAQHANILA